MIKIEQCLIHLRNEYLSDILANDSEDEHYHQHLLLRKLADALWSFPRSVNFHLQQESFDMTNYNNNITHT